MGVLLLQGVLEEVRLISWPTPLQVPSQPKSDNLHCNVCSQCKAETLYNSLCRLLAIQLALWRWWHCWLLPYLGSILA